MDWTWFHRLASPPYIYGLARRLVPWFAWPAGLLIVAATVWGLGIAPADYQQGDGFRIIYVHAPTAWLSLLVYVTMGIAASAAPIGASFTLCALVTGSIWGGPMWGTYWEWDPRITFELLQLFLYLGYMALRASIDDTQRADRTSAVLAVVGVVNVPIVHFSVIWWNSLHQAPSVMKLGQAAMPASMYGPMFVMLGGFTCLFLALTLTRLQAEVLARERAASWIRDAVGTNLKAVNT